MDLSCVVWGTTEACITVTAPCRADRGDKAVWDCLFLKCCLLWAWISEPMWSTSKPFNVLLPTATLWFFGFTAYCTYIHLHHNEAPWPWSIFPKICFCVSVHMQNWNSCLFSKDPLKTSAEEIKSRMSSFSTLDDCSPHLTCPLIVAYYCTYLLLKDVMFEVVTKVTTGAFRTFAVSP